MLDTSTLRMTADIVAAYLSGGGAEILPTSELPVLIRTVHRSLVALDQPAEAAASTAEAAALVPAVSIRKSITPDYLVCLEDGRRLKSMKRHLRCRYGMSPEDYRKRWGLPADYPMVAPTYAKARSEMAKRMGLGTR